MAHVYASLLPSLRKLRSTTSRAYAIWTSVIFGPVGTRHRVDGPPPHLPGISFFEFWPIGLRPIVSAIWIPRVHSSSTALGPREKRASALQRTLARPNTARSFLVGLPPHGRARLRWPGLFTRPADTELRFRTWDSPDQRQLAQNGLQAEKGLRGTEIPTSKPTQLRAFGLSGKSPGSKERVVGLEDSNRLPDRYPVLDLRMMQLVLEHT